MKNVNYTGFVNKNNDQEIRLPGSKQFSHVTPQFSLVYHKNVWFPFKKPGNENFYE